MTKDMETQLQRTQRRMLRLIIGTPRRRQQQPQAQPQPQQQEQQQHRQRQQTIIPPTANTSDDESTDDVNSTTSDTNLQQLMATHNDDEHEPWPEFIKRATRIAEETTKQLNMQEWTTTYWKKQWKWANRIANQQQLRWSRLVAEWDPTTDNPQHAQRKQGRPQKRWDDDINNFLRQANNHNDEHHLSDTNNELRFVLSCAVDRTLTSTLKAAL